MRISFYALPLIIFFILITFFAVRLNLMKQGDNPDIVTSVLIGKPLPSFEIPSLFDNNKLKSTEFTGSITLINFFASWCVPCQGEHAFLADLKRINGLKLVGISYKNKPEDARAWLTKLGNPYDKVGSDLNGFTAIDFGVYGVPESYLIDRQGIIRFKQIGPLTPSQIKNEIIPLVKELMG